MKRYLKVWAGAAIAIALGGPASASVLECTTYVQGRLASSRPNTDITSLRGNAGTWVKSVREKVGKAAISSKPVVGSVMVFAGSGDSASYPSFAKFAAKTYGHVALVAKVEDKNTIRIDHANWREGKTDLGVKTVTSDGWTTASVWNVDAKAMGGGRYAVAGFILPSSLPGKKR